MSEKKKQTLGKHQNGNDFIADISNSVFPIYNITEFKLNKIDRIKSLFGCKIRVQTIIKVDKEVTIENTEVNIQVGKYRTIGKISNVSNIVANVTCV